MSVNLTEGEVIHPHLVINYLTWIDYLVFALMLTLSASIGVFFGCFGKKLRTTEDYLLGGRKMTVFPVCMSLHASFMSAIGMLGISSDAYQNGVQYTMSLFSFILVGIATTYIYLPVYWNLQVTSVNEYLERRFSKNVRYMASVFFIGQMSFYLAIVIYAPSLALAQMTGMEVTLSVTLICFVCIFYTTLGGIKAVMWTDVLQVLVMVGALLVVIIKGTIEEGGFLKVMEINLSNGRQGFFNFDFDPRVRYTFWSLVLGRLFSFTAVYGANQTQVQRYMSVRTKKMAAKTLLLCGLGTALVSLAMAYSGMLAYSKYVECDPIKSRIITKADQIFPFYVMENFKSITAFPGLFISAVFAGALSTISSGFNSLAAIAYEDFIKGYFGTDISEKKAKLYTKGLSIYFGLQTYGLTFVAAQMGGILSAADSIFGFFGGPLLGLFSLGMFVPYANSAGAYGGSLATLLIIGWLTFGYQIGIRTGFVPPRETLPTVLCPNITLPDFEPDDSDLYTNVPTVEEEYSDFNFLREMYKISYWWYSVIGFVVFLAVGSCTSLIFGEKQDITRLEPKLLSPLVRWLRWFYPNYSKIGINWVDHRREMQLEESLELTKESSAN